MLKMNKDMSNREVAKLLIKVAAAFEVKDEVFFRVKAYKNAANSIEQLNTDISEVWKEGKLGDIPGVGENLASHLDELMRTGKVKHFVAEVKGLPEGMFALLDLDGVGPKTAYKLATELKLDKGSEAIEKLKAAIDRGQVREIPGFGETSEKEILKSIENIRIGEDRLLLPEAEKLSGEVAEYLMQSGLCEKVEVLGSLRRRVATVGDVDLAVITDKPDELMEHLLKFSGVKKVLSTGTKTTMFVHKSGRQVDVKTQSRERWGAMLQHYTGSKMHNIHLRKLALEKGLSLSEHGIKSKGKITGYKTEDDFYAALGLEYIPPELREDTGEIEAARSGKLPRLVTLESIKGDMHVHTNLEIETSHDMGSSSVTELLESAKSLGYEYLGLTDHNPKLGLSERGRREVILRRNELIEQQSRSSESDVKIFKGLEVDIRPDGELAIGDELLELLDYVIVSVHASFKQSRFEATKRVLEALSHPKVKIFGHPTGRLLNERDGLDYDWESVFEFCKNNNIAIEINSSPSRLDLPDLLVRDAVKRGVKLVIDSDSHAAEHLSGLRYGIGVARRGWVEANDVVNTLSYEQMKLWLRS